MFNRMTPSGSVGSIFKAGDTVTATIEEGTAGRSRNIQAKVLHEEQPGMFRCETDMGVTMLLSAELLRVP